MFARDARWNLDWRNRNSFIKSFNVDDARPRRRSIIVVIEGVTLAVRYRAEILAGREKIATTTRVFMETIEQPLTRQAQ